LNLLLDTHVALWAITDSLKLSQKARDLILAPKTSVFVSAATIWEIAIKSSLGRGDMPVSARNAMRYFQKSGYRFLPIEAEHTLPLKNCHRTTKTRLTAFLLLKRWSSQCD